MVFEIREIDDTSGEFFAAVDAILDDAAAGLRLPFEPDKLHLRVDDAEGRLAGGLSGYFVQGWLFVKLLAIVDEQRGSGIGRALMLRAEEITRQKGYAGIYLDTFTFQAPRFYESLGYVECGRLPAARGHAQRIWFAKTFDDAGGIRN
ncbi:GNAT family N-acetyltransferase [Hoeflea sp. Naph1]|uniref:GNAT family N-acetyltransferase n=1 Tax=Hoeflea sp. Naph1 TaxID=3388653 RepID=UPI00398FC958